MGSETRVCPRLIGWVVVEEFAGTMYFFGLNYYIIVIVRRISHFNAQFLEHAAHCMPSPY